MAKSGALVLYKNRPALIASIDADRFVLRLADGSSQRVRDKDIVVVHPGPLSSIPDPAPGGDFETARAMLASDPAFPAPADAPQAAWAALAELVFDAAGPAEILACVAETVSATKFRLENGMPRPLSDDESREAAAKAAGKEEEAAERSAFIARARRSAPDPGDGRFMAEIEAFALGKSAKCRLASEIGFSATPEAAHAFLLRTGFWDDMVNPWPSRAGCPLAPPRSRLPSPDEAELADATSRRDFGDLTAYAIDNEWSHDPDDAVSWDGERIWVHVADPACAIPPGSPVDEEALARGATLYLPEKIVPLLPEESVGRFGLGLSDRSFALSFGMALEPDASIREVVIAPSIVRVSRLTYAQADVSLRSGDPVLAALDGLAAARAARRSANGSVEIDIPEVAIRVSPGEVGIHRSPVTRSSAIVREMMLLAGEAAARWAFDRGIAFPFYGQEAPQVTEEVRLDPPGGRAPLSVQFARRRGMRAGMLGPAPTAHRGLGLPFYSQVTSPLRRYQDLLAHMQIRAALGVASSGAVVPMDADEVSSRCAAAGAAGAPNRQAERDSDLHWTAVWLARNPGWTGEATVAALAGPDAVLYVHAIGLETRVRNRSGLAPDDPVTVRLVRADIPTREIVFEVAG